MRIAIYTSNYGTRMKKAIETGKKDFLEDIKLFFTEDSRTHYLKDELEKKGIKYILIEYVDRLTFSNNFLNILKEYEIDYVLCNGKHILEGDILKEYNNKIINFHGALLPAYPGVRMLDKMMNNEEFLVGTTAMFIDEGVDTGPIIMESVVTSKNVQKNGYNIVLDKQVDMIHLVHKLLKENRIIVNNKEVIIKGADYNFCEIFPKVMDAFEE